MGSVATQVPDGFQIFQFHPLVSSRGIRGQDLHRQVSYAATPHAATPAFEFLGDGQNEITGTYTDPRFSTSYTEEDSPLPSFLTTLQQPFFKVSPGTAGKKPKPCSAFKDKFSSGNIVFVGMG
jgi:hypothetical protein